MRTKEEIMRMSPEQHMEEAMRYAESTVQSERNIRDLLTTPNTKNQ